MPNFSYNFAGAGAINATSIVTTGNVTVGGALVGDVGVSGYLGPLVTDATGSLALTAGRAYAQYLGEVPKDIASILATYYLHGVPAIAGAGGVSLNWAEVAIATGTLGQMETNTSLTVIGTPASFNANAIVANTAWYGTVITAPIPARTGLWLIMAASYEVTQVSVRVPANFLNARGYARTANAFQPSLQVGTPTAFAAVVTTGTLVPIMAAQFS